MFWNKKDKQEDAIAALKARSIKFESSELENTLFSAGGSYLVKVNGEDVASARTKFGYLNGKGSKQVVGFLVPSGSDVIIEVDGIVVDRLTRRAASKVLKKISLPTPIKIEVSIVPNRDPNWDRPHLKLMRGTSPPKN
jgi:hypothetical protein